MNQKTDSAEPTFSGLSHAQEPGQEWRVPGFIPPPTWKKLLGWMVFVLLPITLFLVFVFTTASLSEESAKADLDEHLDRQFFGFLHQATPHVFCENQLKTFSRKVEKTLDKPGQLLPLLAEAHRNPAFSFEPYLFDEGGKLVTPKSVPLKNRFVLKTLWGHLVSPQSEKIHLSRNERKLLEALFGTEVTIAGWKQRPDRLIPIRHQNHDGFLFWKPAATNGKGGVILVIWRIPPTIRIFRALGDSLARKNLFLLVPDQSRRYRCFGRRISREIIPLMRNLQKHPRQTIGSAHYVLRRTEADGMKMFIGRSPGMTGYFWWRKALAFFGFMLFFLAGMAFLKFQRQDAQAFFPIRMKVVFLFLFSLVIPSLGVSFLGIRLLEDRQRVLESKTVLQAREELSFLDSGFSGEQERFLQVCRSVRGKIAKQMDLKAIQPDIQKILEKNRILHFELRDLTGGFQLPEIQRSGMENMEFFFDNFSKTAVHGVLARRLKSPEGKGFRPLDEKTRGLYGSSEIGFAKILDGRNNAHFVNIGQTLFFWYWDAFTQPHHPAAFLTILQSMENLHRSFLSKQFSAKKPGSPGKTLHLALSTSDSTAFPAGYRPDPDIQALLEIIRRTGRPVQARVTRQDQPVLIVGQPGKQLAGFALFAVIPVAGTLQAVHVLRNGIILCLISGVLLALGVGTMLGAHFLSPIREIHEGVLALQQRRIDYRVPALHQDEFGELARTFNWMIEDLKEIELAQIVQKSLGPKQLPALPGYDIALKNLVATDLGGDYGDLLPLPDGRILMVLGDVSGHGVGAALGMTLAKAVTFQFAQDGGTPATLLQRLGNIFFRAFQRRKLITFFAGALHPETGEFRFASAGPLPPLLRSSSGTLSVIAPPSDSLGGELAETHFGTGSLFLAPGDSLLLFTDGLLPEIITPDQPDVAVALGHLLESIPAWNSGNAIEKILAGCRHVAEKCAPADDLTLLILHRGGLEDS
jgi:HAMP domain-containing protein